MKQPQHVSSANANASRSGQYAGVTAQTSAFVFNLISDLPLLLAHGILCPAKADEHGITQLQRLETWEQLMATALVLPGRPLASNVVLARFASRNPCSQRIATGYNGVTLRLNGDLVAAVVTAEALDAAGVQHLFCAGNPIAGGPFALKPDGLDIDLAALRAGDFSAGRGMRFDAGLIVPFAIPIRALVGLACATAAARDIVAAHVAAAGLDQLPVSVVPNLFFWPPSQPRAR